MNKLLIGALETVNLPDLKISDLHVRVDTGAKTSSLHVDNIETLQKAGKPWVKFDLHPDLYKLATTVRCEAPISDIRRIKSSNGESEQRYVIRTTLEIANQAWPIDITLSNRADMTYLMLLGRESMEDRILVDPSQNFIAGMIGLND